MSLWGTKISHKIDSNFKINISLFIWTNWINNSGHYLCTNWCKVKVKLVILVEGEPKAPFSKITTLRCKGGRYSIPSIAPTLPLILTL